MAQCSQCGKPAIVEYQTHPLCVEHYRMMMQIEHSRLSWIAANLNVVRGELNAGGLIQDPMMEIPPNPFIGGDITLNNLNISQSTIGSLNTGNIVNLDAGITIMRSRGENELAAAIKEFTEAVSNSNEINKAGINEINEQLEFLVAQATAEPQNRSIGTVKSVLSGIQSSISSVAGLLTIWNNIEPLFKAAFGIG